MAGKPDRRVHGPLLTANVDTIEPQPRDYSYLTSVSGEHDAREAFLCTAEDGLRVRRVGVFTCQPCSMGTVPTEDETVLLLEGEARIEVDGEAPVELGPGDFVIIPEKTPALWEFKTPVRAFFVVS